MTKSTDAPELVQGRTFGIDIPTSVESFRRAGSDFLTEAFRAAGALSADNSITQIMRCDEFEAGGMGPKLKLDVAYARDAPNLHRTLFVKLPRPFGDPLRQLFAPVVEPEIRLYLLARSSAFPVRTPRLYFGDYDPITASSILITERIAYGADGIEPCHEKALDYKLSDTASYYDALSRAGAHLAGAHRAGRLGAEVDKLFPFDPDAVDVGAAIPYSYSQLNEKLGAVLAFAARAPQLFPPELRNPKFLEGFVDSAPAVLEKESAIRRRLNHASDFVALCHWNLNLDNAWFWREGGALQVGLLDWGATAQMHLAQSFFGMICAAEGAFVNAHRDRLIELWCDVYRRAGGCNIAVDQFREDYKLAVALLGIAWIIDAPTIIATQVADLESLSGREDSRLEKNFLARAQRQIFMLFLNEWRALDIGAAVARL